MKAIEVENCPRIEIVVTLKQVLPGKVVRFAHISYNEAIKEDLFYMVVGTAVDKRVTLACTGNGELIKRDEEWPVVEHKVELLIQQAPF